MIQKYYNSILEQVFAQIGKKEHNIVLAKYKIGRASCRERV